MLVKTIVSNFCTSREIEPMSRSFNESVLNEAAAHSEQPLNHSAESPPVKSKKAVTFKTGLVTERSFRNFHEALISKEQVNILPILKVYKI